MRISDWISYVCSSDLVVIITVVIAAIVPVVVVVIMVMIVVRPRPIMIPVEIVIGEIDLASQFAAQQGCDIEHEAVVAVLAEQRAVAAVVIENVVPGAADQDVAEIGRASCRERVCKYV